MISPLRLYTPFELPVRDSKFAVADNVCGGGTMVSHTQDKKRRARKKATVDRWVSLLAVHMYICIVETTEQHIYAQLTSFLWRVTLYLSFVSPNYQDNV